MHDGLPSSKKRPRSTRDESKASLAFRPFLDLPVEVLSQICSFMDVSSLLALRQASKKAKVVASSDDAGWIRHCHRLWKGKVHVLHRARQLLMETKGQQHKAFSAYLTSCHDALVRQELTEQDLCYDPTSQSGTIWSFRFKASAGTAWTEFDPWHAGNEARTMVFLRDGTIQQLIVQNSSSVDRDESSSPLHRLIPPFSDHHPQRHQVVGAAAAGIVMNWRYVYHPLDSPRRPQGAYIRINVSGRDVPTYIVQRAPKQFKNWGFIMDSLWGVFSSFPLPRRRQVMRLRRTSAGDARWFNVDGMESDESDGNDEEDSHRDGGTSNLDRLLCDSALPTTNQRQWREALLYNYGTVVLPDGEEVRKEFDRLFQPQHGQK